MSGALGSPDTGRLPGTIWPTRSSLCTSRRPFGRRHAVPLPRTGVIDTGERRRPAENLSDSRISHAESLAVAYDASGSESLEFVKPPVKETIESLQVRSTMRVPCCMVDFDRCLRTCC